MDIASIITYIALAIVSAIGGLVLAEFRKLKALIKGTQMLLKSELYSMYLIGIKRGYASLGEKYIFKCLYEQYHALGKNGSMTAYMKQYLDLPVEPKDKRGNDAKGIQ